MNSAAKDVRDWMGGNNPGAVFGIVRVLLTVGLLLLFVPAAPAQMFTPVNIKNPDAVRNEFGDILVGSSAIDSSKRCLVQIYWASNSVIHPPDYEGLPHPYNAPVEGGKSAIGNLVSPALLMPGRFSAALANPRPSQNSRIFVRVFNAPTIEKASFYADSQVLRVSNNDVLIANIGDTVNPIDPRDFDGDGLHNSWEKSLGTDPWNRDTDGNGMSDYHEFLAGTDPLDPNSIFAAARIAVGENGEILVAWSSVPGKRYIVQCQDPTYPGWTEYEDVTDVIMSQGYETQTAISGEVSERAMYRVRLVVE